MSKGLPFNDHQHKSKEADEHAQADVAGNAIPSYPDFACLSGAVTNSINQKGYIGSKDEYTPSYSDERVCEKFFHGKHHGGRLGKK